MSNQSRCPIFNTNILDENECIFVWELTVTSSKTEKLKKTLADADFNLDYVDITNNGETTSFESGLLFEEFLVGVFRSKVSVVLSLVSCLLLNSSLIFKRWTTIL